MVWKNIFDFQFLKKNQLHSFMAGWVIYKLEVQENTDTDLHLAFLNCQILHLDCNTAEAGLHHKQKI